MIQYSTLKTYRTAPLPPQYQLLKQTNTMTNKNLSKPTWVLWPQLFPHILLHIGGRTTSIISQSSKSAVPLTQSSLHALSCETSKTALICSFYKNTSTAASYRHPGSISFLGKLLSYITEVMTKLQSRWYAIVNLGCQCRILNLLKLMSPVTSHHKHLAPNQRLQTGIVVWSKLSVNSESVTAK